MKSRPYLPTDLTSEPRAQDSQQIVFVKDIAGRAHEWVEDRPSHNA
jgi:hypothetical protein